MTNEELRDLTVIINKLIGQGLIRLQTNNVDEIISASLVNGVVNLRASSWDMAIQDNARALDELRGWKSID